MIGKLKEGEVDSPIMVLLFYLNFNYLKSHFINF